MLLELTLSNVENVLSVALGTIVALGLAVVVRERFPAVHRGWLARRGRRPILYIGALLTWTVVGIFGLMAVVSLLALVFPDGDWEARPSDIVELLIWTGLGAALALPLTLWWWRSTAPAD